MARAERLQKIRLLLLSKRSLGVPELMSRLEVSRATVFRDIEFLRDRLGMPIERDEELGGYRLAPQQAIAELPGVWLSADEIHALLSMQQLLEGIDASGILHDQLKPLRKRLIGMLGSGDHSAEEIAQRIRIIAAAPRRCEVSSFQTVASALLGRRRLMICYRARGNAQVSNREVSPQRLIHYRDNWYLDAWCHHRDALRSFSVDAIEHAKSTDQAACEVEDCELDRQLASGYGIFAGAAVQWAVLHFSPQRARWVAGEQWHPQQQSRWLETGGYELRLPFSAAPELIMDILKYGPDCQVIAPDDLRASVISLLEEARGRYG